MEKDSGHDQQHRQRRRLTEVPCNHYWLAIEYRGETVIAICKHYGCRKRGQFSAGEWIEMKLAKVALDKPIRL